MPKAERHEQLLETALAIIGEQGADALTLGVLAERAGVSKPVTYEHFGTRSGLLIELYKRIDDRQAADMTEALAHAPRELAAVARVISVSYLTCHITAGPEWHAISAALKGNAEMAAVQQELVERCIEILRDALAPFSALPAGELHVRCVGLIGAAEALSQRIARGLLGEARAIDNLTALIVGGIDAKN
ncbi:TetR/AcrR family transcriptional regulator [Nocardia puris]|nr:TetR/AcrR family transcriptional regulator [Nocardia puris]MBF6364961.1 TetR/AcrR family transcriptional regulator [Nocardia puris]MBF6458747.1 TetR/AcrR family transcriptional regulator [Nocardia puris]